MPDTGDVLQPSALVVAEYSSLRQECLARIAQRQFLLALGLTAFAGLVPVGLTDAQNTHLVLAATPVILLFIALSWARNGLVLVRCSAYLRSVEKRFPEIQWETAGRQLAPDIRGGRPIQLLLDHSGQLLFIAFSWGALGLFASQVESRLVDYGAFGAGTVAGVIMTYAMLTFGPISPLSAHARAPGVNASD